MASAPESCAPGAREGGAVWGEQDPCPTPGQALTAAPFPADGAECPPHTNALTCSLPISFLRQAISGSRPSIGIPASCAWPRAEAPSDKVGPTPALDPCRASASPGTRAQLWPMGTLKYQGGMHGEWLMHKPRTPRAIGIGHVSARRRRITQEHEIVRPNFFGGKPVSFTLAPFFHSFSRSHSEPRCMKAHCF